MNSESAISVETILSAIIAFLAYFVGVIIRKVALSKENSPSLANQLLLGIPVSLVVVSPLAAVMLSAVKTSFWSGLISLGVIMEHGMLLNETLTRHLNALRSRLAGPSVSGPA